MKGRIMDGDLPSIELTQLEGGYSREARVSHYLRWSLDGKLQQAWVVTTYDMVGTPLGQRHEWRDVPTEKE